jgi:hypothetical protein
MDIWSAKCLDCRYRLWGRGQIGTECFGDKHALKQKHEVHIFKNSKLYLIMARRGTLDVASAPDVPPF